MRFTILFKNVNTEVSAAGKVTQSVTGVLGPCIWIRNISENVQPMPRMLHSVLGWAVPSW